MQITLNLELTPENLDKLRIFCEEVKAAPAEKKTTKKTAKTAEPAKTETTPAEATPAETTPASKPEAESEAPAEENVAAPTKTDVRAVALKLSKAGKSDVLKEIFAKFGAEKLSDVKEEQYADLMKELNAVG